MNEKLRRPVLVSFADRLNWLFEAIYPPGLDQPFRNSQVIDALAAQGVYISAPYLSQLRSSYRTAPSWEVVQALADFFGLSADYFTDCAPAYTARLDRELAWLECARDPEVRALTELILQLPDNAQRELIDYLDQRKSARPADHDVRQR